MDTKNKKIVFQGEYGFFNAEDFDQIDILGVETCTLLVIRTHKDEKKFCVAHLDHFNLLNVGKFSENSKKNIENMIQEFGKQCKHKKLYFDIYNGSKGDLSILDCAEYIKTLNFKDKKAIIKEHPVRYKTEEKKEVKTVNFYLFSNRTFEIEEVKKDKIKISYEELKNYDSSVFSRHNLSQKRNEIQDPNKIQFYQKSKKIHGLSSLRNIIYSQLT